MSDFSAVQDTLPDDALWPGVIVPTRSTGATAESSPIPPTVKGPILDPTYQATNPGVVGLMGNKPGPVVPWDTHAMRGNVQRLLRSKDNYASGPVGRDDYGSDLAYALAQQGVNAPVNEAQVAALQAAL